MNFHTEKVGTPPQTLGNSNAGLSWHHHNHNAWSQQQSKRERYSCRGNWGLWGRRAWEKKTKMALTVISFNAESFSSIKSQLISAFYHEYDCDVLCLHETHRGETQARPAIPIYTLVNEIQHHKHGSAKFLQQNAPFESTANLFTVNRDQVSVKLNNISINNIYQPPNSAFAMAKRSNTSEPMIYIGDFNSHDPQRGYSDEDEKGKELVFFIEQHNLALIHDAKVPFTFHSSRWRKRYNPDLILMNDRKKGMWTKVALPPVPGSQQWPILLRVTLVAKARDTPFQRRELSDEQLGLLQQRPRIVPHLRSRWKLWKLIDCVRRASNRNIPRRCWTKQIPGLDDSAKDILNACSREYNLDPFSWKESRAWPRNTATDRINPTTAKGGNYRVYWHEA